MTTMQNIITIFIVVLGTLLTRSISFLIFYSKPDFPPFIQFLETVFPSAVIGVLVVYCLKDSLSGGYYGLPEMMGIFCVVFFHNWKKNVLLSISMGTSLYMVLVQTCFK